MYNARGSFWYSLATWNDFYQCVIQGHDFFDSRTELCAWTEGWGDFLAVVVNGDQCYDKGLGPCTGTLNFDYFNVENQNWNDGKPRGDKVEGRIAGALYDLYDNANDGFDQIGLGFAPIWSVVKNPPVENSFHDFWNSWKANGNNPIQSLLAFYQNTIDYGVWWNYLPVILK